MIREMQALRAQLAELAAELDRIEQELDGAQAPQGPADEGANADGPVPTMPASDKDTASVTAMFKAADRNGDGAIDFAETVAHEDGDVAKARLHFADADRNGDNKVDLGEWLWHHQYSPLEQGEPMAPMPGMPGM
jgi:hypothetical protein